MLEFSPKPALRTVLLCLGSCFYKTNIYPTKKKELLRDYTGGVYTGGVYTGGVCSVFNLNPTWTSVSVACGQCGSHNQAQHISREVSESVLRNQADYRKHMLH